MATARRTSPASGPEQQRAALHGLAEVELVARDGLRPAATSNRIADGLFLAGLLALAAVRQVVPLAPPDTPNTPGVAIAAVPRSLVGEPVLNSYGFAA